MKTILIILAAVIAASYGFLGYKLSQYLPYRKVASCLKHEITSNEFEKLPKWLQKADDIRFVFELIELFLFMVYFVLNILGVLLFISEDALWGMMYSFVLYCEITIYAGICGLAGAALGKIIKIITT